MGAGFGKLFVDHDDFSEFKKLQTEFNTYKQQTTTTKELLGKQTQLQNSINELIAQKGALELSIGNLQTKLNLYVDVDKLLTQKFNLDAEIRNLNAEKSRLTAEIGSVDTKLGLAYRVNELNAEKSRLTTEIGSVSTNRGLAYRVNELNVEKSRLVAEIGSVDTKLGLLYQVSELKKTELALQKSNSLLRGTEQILNASIKALTGQETNLKKSLETLNMQVSAKTTELKTLEEQHKLTAQLVATERQVLNEIDYVNAQLRKFGIPGNTSSELIINLTKFTHKYSLITGKALCTLRQPLKDMIKRVYNVYYSNASKQGLDPSTSLSFFCTDAGIKANKPILGKHIFGYKSFKDLSSAECTYETCSSPNDSILAPAMVSLYNDLYDIIAKEIQKTQCVNPNTGAPVDKLNNYKLLTKLYQIIDDMCTNTSISNKIQIVNKNYPSDQIVGQMYKGFGPALTAISRPETVKIKLPYKNTYWGMGLNDTVTNVDEANALKFQKIPGLCGPDTVSFRSVDNPNNYYKYAGGQDPYFIWKENTNMTDPYNRASACFKPIKNNCKNSNAVAYQRMAYDPMDLEFRTQHKVVNSRHPLYMETTLPSELDNTTQCFEEIPM